MQYPYPKAFVIVLLFFIAAFSANAQDIQIAEPPPVNVECGTIIEGEFSSNYELHRYTLEMAPGDAINANVEPLGGQLTLTLTVYGPSGLNVAFAGEASDIRGYGGDESGLFPRLLPLPDINTDILSARGNYTIVVSNHLRRIEDLLFPRFFTATNPDRSSGGVGVYTLYIGCTLRNGTVIAPGDSLQPETDAPAPSSNQPAAPVFSGFGFPGVMPVDFSNGIEIPLSKSQPQTIPLGGDVALYTYQAVGGESAKLTASRLSGDISMGVTVINKDTNEIIFLAGLPSSNNLSVDLTFPTDGTYAIGLFRLDTVERSGTSGAVQLMLE